MKKLYLLLTAITCVFANYLNVNAQASVCCPYNGWDWVVPITVSNSTGATIPAQSTLFIINTAAPISAGKMNVSGNDIRFVYNTCGNYLNYWIESGINTNNTNIWIALPAIPDGSSITIYMYYGNPSAPTGASAQTVLFPNIQTITGAQTLSGTITADWIDVNGATITMPAGNPLTLQARRIIFNGTFNGDNRGYGPAAGPGAGGNGGGSCGGGGGGYGGNGGTGGCGGGSGGSAYGTPNGNDIGMGSGGGGSDCSASASGGGALSLIGSVVSVAGTINVRGQSAQYCCCGNSSEAAGGGAGGGVLVQGDYVSGNATINANGGAGGGSDDKEGGGGGAGGRVKIRWCKANTFNGSVNVAGGPYGTPYGQTGMQPGQTGTYTQPQVQCDAIVIGNEVPVSIPTASFTYFNACTGVVTSFTSTSTVQSGGSITTYNWSYGDGTNGSGATSTHNYAAQGNYTVSLSVTTATGCTASATQNINVQTLPTADFTASNACEGNNTQFTDASTGGAVKWLWSFGDGNFDTTQQNPTHIYGNAGNFNATLVVLNSSNCADTVTKPVTVQPGVNASFNWNGLNCTESVVSFTNTTTYSGSGTLSYMWWFGDGGTSTLQNPQHIYTNSDTMQVILTVTSGSGCSDSTLLSLPVFGKPVADFAFDTVCFGNTTSFNSTGVFWGIGNSNVASYFWNFGNGQTSGTASEMHQFTAAGNFNVVHTVIGDNGCADTVAKQVPVNAVPVVDFTTGSVCLNQSNLFSNTTSIASGTVAQWLWDFGDAATSTQQNPLHTYLAQGSYNVSLVAISDKGCADSVSKPVNVFDKPVAAFTASEVCLGNATVFTDGSSIGTGSIVQWNYAFGNGQNAPTANPTHTYSAAGNFNAALVVTSDNGCTDTAFQTVVINPLPQISFSGTNVCISNTTMFSNNTSISSGNISSWNWDFGDGNSSTQQNTSNLYAATGTYAVQLTAISDKGCQSSSTVNVLVFELPTVTTSSLPACYQQNNGVINAAGANGTAPYNFLWSNGTTGTAALNLFAGNYSVTISDFNSCTASATATVTEPSGPLSVFATPGNPNIKLSEMVSISLSNSYNDASATYSVSPTYGLSCVTCAQFDAIPYQTTNYFVEVTDGNGCTGNGQFTVIVDQSIPVFIPNVFSPNSDGANDTWCIYSMAVKYVDMKVFNRWGEKVFETNNLNDCWDGTYQGKPAETGVYVYSGTIGFLNNVSRQVKGSITLLK
ncbi:MAG: DUF2341 domain-containing protein [Chitinophagales bacterium]|nr:DUF2341 domain-containing protein [Chitinophagales bacterium]